MGSRTYNLFFLALILAIQPYAAESKQLYRWVDDQGKVHYADIVPPEESKYGRSRLSDKGITLEKIEPAKTKQQLAQIKRLVALRAEKQKIIAEQLAYDSVLLRTFRNTDEIQMTLDGKLQTLNLLSRLTQDNIKRLKGQLSLQQKRAAGMEKSGRKVPQRLLNEINATRRQIQENRDKITAQTKGKERLKNKFKIDEERFIALQKQIKSTQRKEEFTSSKAIISAVECKTPSGCNKAWLRARRYVTQHATTPLQIETATLLMTKQPVIDQDLSLTVTRIKGSGKQRTQLFLDAECKPSTIGIELCESQKVQNILSGFAAFVSPQK